MKKLNLNEDVFNKPDMTERWYQGWGLLPWLMIIGAIVMIVCAFKK